MTKVEGNCLDRKVRDAALPLLEELGSPRALTVALMLRYHEYQQLAELKVIPNHYDRAERYAIASAATNLFRKYVGLPVSTDTRQAAVKTWWDAEARCARTNVRLKDFTEGCVVNHDVGLPEIRQAVEWMREFSRVVLGRMPSKLDFRFGPGATESDCAKLATVPDKCTSLPTLTSGCTDLVPLWDRTAWARAHYRRQHASTSPPIQTIRGNSFFVVPKTALTDRGAATGPSINVSGQLGVGRLLRDCLLAIGIDLDHGQALHQLLARKGSLDESNVTIDLETASDTSAKEFVRLHIPPLWYDLFCTLREPLTKIEGRWTFLEKFSAMGNGFTFELETLGFLAIISAAVRFHGDDIFRLIANQQLSVYGDDIIVPREYARTVCALLRFFGFKLNEKKTFLSGEFRESCGGDYFSGKLVTPLYLKKEIDAPDRWISFHNGVVALAKRLTESCGRLFEFKSTLARIRQNVPSDIRECRGPTWLGDVVFHDFTWPAFLHERRGLWWLKTYAPLRRSVSWDHFYPDVQLASALYGVPSSGAIPRGVEGYRIKRVGRPRFSWSDTVNRSSLIDQIERVTGIGDKNVPRYQVLSPG